MPTIAPVIPSVDAALRLRPVGLAHARIDGGFWAERLRVNRQRTIPHGAAMLESHGNLENFVVAAAGGPPSAYRHTEGDGGHMPFLDTDVTKWLEAVAWELARVGSEGDALLASAEPMIALLGRAQRRDGYLDTFYQVALPGREFQELAWGHELYTAGHLVQAGIAWKRALDDERLLDIATRFVERIEAEMGPGRREAICGHPEFEMALVELFRTTGERRYLDFARTLIERRGHGLLGDCRFGRAYWQDHEPVRSAAVPAGHAVRQMYLDCGAADVAMETGDRELLDAVRRRWDAMLRSYTYVTGGLGAHHQDEAFGAAFELPSDRAYAETCAAIGSAMLSWRLLLATGEERFADLIERQAYNAILPALAPDGASFFYTNPLMQRSGVAEVAEGIATTRRTAWPHVACCPPNLMRFLASFPDLAMTSTEDGVQVHQYATGRFGAVLAGGGVELRVRTDYPWDGRVDIEVVASVDSAWTLSLRVPSWCRAASAFTPDGAVSAEGSDRIEIRRQWHRGDRVRLDLEMPPRLTYPDPRIDAVRGCLALERGPLVYAVEDADLPAGASVESVEVVEPANVEIEAARRSDAAIDGLVGLSFDGFLRSDTSAAWPYGSPVRDQAEAARKPVRIGALPYFAWANRRRLGMRIWLPARRRVASGG